MMKITVEEKPRDYVKLHTLKNGEVFKFADKLIEFSGFYMLIWVKCSKSDTSTQHILSITHSDVGICEAREVTENINSKDVIKYNANLIVVEA